MTQSVFERFLATPEMSEIFGAASMLQAMLDVEAALARAQAAEGMIPAAAAEAIAAACRVERFDLDLIVAEGTVAGTLAVPLVKRLTAEVARDAPEAAAYVHWGSTSQDVIDTGVALGTRRALALIDGRVVALIDALLVLADRDGDAPMLGRTLLQPALVISFGFKLVAWVAPLVRARARLRRAAEAALQMQLGGAVGTLAAMGGLGPAVASRMAEALGLGLPPGAWHTQRDDWVALGCEVGILGGSLGKIAKDLSLLSQAEVGEVAEPSGGGRGGSSAMPHKRNPVASMIALAAALRTPQRVAALLAAMPQEHERGLGGWQAELAEWPGLFVSVHAAASALAEAMAGLTVDTARMRANIDALRGLVFAEAVSMRLARHLGKSRAHALLETLSRRVVAEGISLRELTLEAVQADPLLREQLPVAEVAALFDTNAVAGRASALARPRLDAWRASRLQPDLEDFHR